MSTHALDSHHDDIAHAPLLSGMSNMVEEKMPNSIKAVYQRAKNRVNQVLSIPTQIREMIDKVKDGHPLSKAEWKAISVMPLGILVAGYYIVKVAENTGNGIINEVKSQYHAMREGFGLRKDATPDEFPEAVAKHEAHHDSHGDHARVDQSETNHKAPKPKAHATPVAHTDAHAANDDHGHHHAVEHPGEHAEAA